MIQSLINKEKIDTIYQDYCNEQYYIFDALDYRQLNNLIYQEIMTKLETIPHFYNPDLIVVPTLDASLNKMLIQDYQYVTLKYGEQKIADGFKQQLDPFEQYGFYGYHFTDLQYINHFDHIYYFYLDQTKKIYLFDQQQKKFISQFPICDKDYFDKVEVDHNLLIEIVELAQTEYPVEFLSSMFLMNLITEKTYRAILSKVGNH